MNFDTFLKYSTEGTWLKALTKQNNTLFTELI